MIVREAAVFCVTRTSDDITRLGENQQYLHSGALRGFWPTLLACVTITIRCFWLFALSVRRFYIELL